ncbi:hypothetical protein [Alkalicoccobacillus murimartini]|uniref:Uncharacterized protein n=1 Tax=Alkalicoccobacillus murimartini TaxID=171685 RepID=A0ABT9YNK4_9BACI|nr:hypothetical protein [Alkalicoccobacillus murimartini]MDQ0209070.1 hypothetical protein [Alkalicoccobacillus murimartini]
MNKILAATILGMGLTGAILISSIPMLFESPIGNVWKIVTVSSAGAFGVLAVLAFVFRRRLNEKSE